MLVININVYRYAMTNNILSPGAALAAKRKKEKKVCPSCQEKFIGIKTAIYCSNKCRQRAKNARNRANNA